MTQDVTSPSTPRAATLGDTLIDVRDLKMYFPLSGGSIFSQTSREVSFTPRARSAWRRFSSWPA